MLIYSTLSGLWGALFLTYLTISNRACGTNTSFQYSVFSANDPDIIRLLNIVDLIKFM